MFDLLLADESAPIGEGDLGIDEVGFVDAGAGEGVLITLFKRRESGAEGHVKLKPETIEKIKSGLSKSKTITLAKFQEVVARFEKDEGRPLEEILADLKPADMAVVMRALGMMDPEPVKPAEPDKPPEPVAASATPPPDEPTQKSRDEAIAKAQADIDVAKREASEAKAEVAKLKNERAFELAKRRASTELKVLGGTEDIAKELLFIAELRATNKDAADRYEKRLTDDARALGQSALFAALGETGEGADPTNDTPKQALMRKAKELAASEKISFGKALARVSKEHPELYEAADAEHLEKARGRS